MMSRLEELLDDLPYTIRHSGELEPLKQFAREQAERVQELEKWRNKVTENVVARNAEYTKCREQNKRYREVIENMKKKISKQLEGLDAEEEMQRVAELSELMSMTIRALEGE